MLKDRQKSEFDGVADCIIIESCTIQLLTRRRSFGIGLFGDKAWQGRLVSRRLVSSRGGAPRARVRPTDKVNAAADVDKS
jgi:hypothetical protein